MDRYHYCNHTDKIHKTHYPAGFSLTPYTGQPSFYVRPYSKFSQTAINRTVPCSGHKNKNIPHCIVPVKDYVEELQDKIKTYRWQSGLRSYLMRTTKTKQLQSIQVKNTTPNKSNEQISNPCNAFSETIASTSNTVIQQNQLDNINECTTMKVPLPPLESDGMRRIGNNTVIVLTDDATNNNNNMITSMPLKRRKLNVWTVENILNARDVMLWLRSIGMSKYDTPQIRKMFEDCYMDGEGLKEMVEDDNDYKKDLADFGIKRFADQKKIVKAIKKLY